MNYTTMTMFAPRIWGSDPEMRMARQAGWRRADLIWERLSEAGNAALSQGRTGPAARAFRLAHLVAWLCFARTDPRYATSLANAGLMAMRRGRTGTGARRLARARALWQRVPERLPDITIAPRARSSLFHLRMEARHRDTYHSNMRARLLGFVEETARALNDLSEGRATDLRFYSRWRGEKPNVFDDTRIYLSAALLLAGEHVDQARTPERQ
ncbi:tetratricopeptide repeat-containing protein [Roseovarius sp. CAU 1744]|uniref:tetratricopeptide repeat-containing protein n=1 Tax=Roseovarius sp. CAU 1744 TaxID=3140368 RepID=UPI00325B235D